MKFKKLTYIFCFTAVSLIPEVSYARLIFNPVRSVSLGGAGVALEDISMPLKVNPGSIALPEYGRSTFFYANIEGSQHLFASEYVFPFKRYASLGMGARVDYIDPDNYTSNYLFGIGLKPWNNFGAGVCARAVMETSSGDYFENFAFDAGINYYPFSWLGIGITGENIVKPSEDDSPFVHTTNIRSGLSLLNNDYLRFVCDFHFLDIPEDTMDMDIIEIAGVEISVSEALKVRTGVKDDTWSMGLGVDSGKIMINYAYMPSGGGVHYIEAGIRLAMAPSIREEKIASREDQLERDGLYLEAVRSFNAGRIASSKRKINEYIIKYGEDERIEKLSYDIRDWLEKVRKEKMGRVRELEKEILKAYYSQRIEKAFILLDNLKIIAPNYEEVLYLEHLLKARVMLEEGSYAQAEDELVKALKINPESQDVRDLHRRLREVLKLEE